MSVVGKIISISELSVKVLLLDQKVKIKDILFCKFNNQVYRFEVIEISENIASLLPFGKVNGLKRGIDVELKEGRIAD